MADLGLEPSPAKSTICISEEDYMARDVTVRWVTGMKAEAAIGPHRLTLA